MSGRLLLAVLPLLLVLAGALGGCATVRALSAPGEQPLPPRARVGVPFFSQDRYYCGPAALAMVLGWSGTAVSPNAIVEHVYTHGREGSLRTDVLAMARRLGRLAVPVTTTTGLLRELAAGHPVVVFQNLGLPWLPQWHLAVAVGYDLETSEIVLNSGVHERRMMSLRTFERTWVRGGRWALVVLLPDTLPVSVDETAVVLAAAGLERAGRSLAVTAYTTITTRWPGSYPGLIGLGNARCAIEDYAGAEAAFRAATVRQRAVPAALEQPRSRTGQTGADR